MGHNELDNPSFTQPLMYKLIKHLKPARDIYKKQLIDDGVDEAKIKAIEDEALDHMETAYAKSKDMKYALEDWNNEIWEQVKTDTKYGDKIKNTGVNLDYLRQIGTKIATLPTHEKFHRSVAKIFD
jgi:2-oxoglutarate dehydrogenase E1 component